MIDLEICPSQLTDGELAVEAARSLSRRAHTGEVDLGFSCCVEDELRGRWYADGYRFLMTFVDKDCNPMVISRLNRPYDEDGHIRDDKEICYRFFIDGGTRDIAIPRQLADGGAQPFHKGEDYTFYDLNNEDHFARAVEDERVASDLAWLYERFGQTLVSHASDEDSISTPYVASEREILGVRLDAFFPKQSREKLFTTPY
jgi:hypothetical protein